MILLVFLVFFLLFSCTEDYSLQIMDDAHILLVNGCITNDDGPYRVQLFDNVSKISGSGKPVMIPVTEARLTITDNLGNVDELKPLWEEKMVEIQEFWYYNYDGTPQYRKRYYLLMPNYIGGYDSLLLNYPVNPYHIEDAIGAYYTTSTVGVPGRSYTLEIEYRGRTYTATDRMPGGAIIDSVVLVPSGKGIDGKNNDDFDIPHLYFAEPQNETNYYLFTYSIKDDLFDPGHHNFFPQPAETFESIIHKANQKTGSWTWNFFIVSDRFMSPYMFGYKMDDGAATIPWITGSDYGFSFFRGAGSIDIYMASVSHEAYRYYQSLIGQFYQDGGAFSQAPASPPTNISNGGQGFFMATHVSHKRARRDYEWGW
jgi:hypothetical protein